jgi:uncharacterized protein (DUF488 family)
MKTSNFKTYRGDMGISICLYPPLDYAGAQYPSLAPDRQTFFAKKAGDIDEKEYEKQYREKILSKFDPKEIYEQLQRNVLLCFEPAGEFCHRRIFSDWIQENLGIEIPEWQPGDDDPDNFQKPLF